MSAITSVALVGLGEVGQILADDLAVAGLKGVTAFDILFAKPGSLPARAGVPVRKCQTLAEAVSDRELVISAVTAASDAEVAVSTAPFLRRGAYFLDVNSVSPGQKQRAASVINQAGGRYVEAAVMSPFGPKRIRSPLLLGGPHAVNFLSDAAALGFSGARAYSTDYGKASATKMCRSVMIKGIEALLSESLLTARKYGVEESVLASLSDLLPIGDWNKLATYMVSRTLEHGKRRAEEMREVAETVSEAGLEPLMSLACAARQAWAAQYRDATADNLPALLDQILFQVEQSKNTGKTGVRE